MYKRLSKACSTISTDQQSQNDYSICLTSACGTIVLGLICFIKAALIYNFSKYCAEQIPQFNKLPPWARTGIAVCIFLFTVCIPRGNVNFFVDVIFRYHWPISCRLNLQRHD